MRRVGWRWTYIVLGGVVFTTMAIAGGLLFRDRPERFGLTLDVGRAAARRRARAEPLFSRSAAVRTAVFWTMSAANVASNAIGTGLRLNHYDLLARNGVPRDVAVTLFTPLAIMQLVAVLLAGGLVDRFPPHRVLALPMCAMATAACSRARAALAHGRSCMQEPLDWPWAGSRRSMWRPTPTTSVGHTSGKSGGSPS